MCVGVWYNYHGQNVDDRGENMFENVSQWLFNTGVIGYIIAPVLRLLGIVFMAISTYKLLRARGDDHKLLWIVAIFASPIIARIAFEIYRRWICKKEVVRAKGSIAFLMASIASLILAMLLTVISVFLIGAGYIKSEIDGEPLATFYDVHGNEYHDLYDVLLYDREGNTYTHESAWFTNGYYIDQNGNSYDGSYCYLSEDGYFYFDEKNELKPYKDSYDYYTDGETVFYFLWCPVYWEEDGSIYEKSGRHHLELFDFD